MSLSEPKSLSFSELNIPAIIATMVMTVHEPLDLISVFIIVNMKTEAERVVQVGDVVVQAYEILRNATHAYSFKLDVVFCSFNVVFSQNLDF